MTNGDAKNKHITLAYSIAYNSCVFNRPKGAEIVLLNAPGRGGKFLRFSYEAAPCLSLWDRCPLGAERVLSVPLRSPASLRGGARGAASAAGLGAPGVEKSCIRAKAAIYSL